MGDLDLLVELVGEHADCLVGERLRERGHLAELHQLLDHLGCAKAEGLRDLLDGGARVDLCCRLLLLRLGLRREVGLDPRRAAAASAATARRLLDGRRPLGATGSLRVDHHAPAAATRSAALLGAALRTLRTLAAVALLRLLPGLLGLPRRGLLARLGAVAGGRRLGLGLLRGSGFGAVRERAGDVVLVDTGGGSLHVKARLLEHGKNLLAGDSALLGYFMNSLLGHSR